MVCFIRTCAFNSIILLRDQEKNLEVQWSHLMKRWKNDCLRPDLTVASCIVSCKKSSSKIYYSVKHIEDQVIKASFINDQLGIEILGSSNSRRFKL